MSRSSTSELESRCSLARPSSSKEFLGEAVLEVTAANSDEDPPSSPRIALHLPDGEEVATSSPFSTLNELSPDRTRLLKHDGRGQAIVCEASSGKVLWQTCLAYPSPPKFPPVHFHFDATGKEVQLPFMDKDERPRLARWDASTGKVVAALMLTFDEPRTVTGGHPSPGGQMVWITEEYFPWTFVEGSILSNDERFILKPSSDAWSRISETLFDLAYSLEEQFRWLTKWDLTSNFDPTVDEKCRLVVDTRSGRSVGHIVGELIHQPVDRSYFVVHYGNSLRVYSIPPPRDWNWLFMWAFTPPLAFCVTVRLATRYRARRRVKIA